MISEIDTSGPDSEQDVMARYGIIRVPTEYFLCGQYRYSHLKDAIAQGKRDALVSEFPESRTGDATRE